MDMAAHHSLISSAFMPHGYCYNWAFSLVALHVISDGLIALSYYMIPFTLAYFVMKRKDLPFNWMFICFALFIVSCGSTHVMEIWTLWHANYWASGFLKAITAIVSFTTAILLIFLMPAALKLPSPRMLAESNRSLKNEIKERLKKETVLESAFNTIEEQNKQILEVSRLKSEFLANMSHELRTPLNSIIGFTDLIHQGLTGPITPQQKEYLGDVLNSSRHLLTIISEILDLSKIEAGKMKFYPEDLNIKQLLEQVVESFSIQIAEKQMQVKMVIDPKLENIFLDPAKLKQVLYNLISNALKFTDNGGSIEIRIHPEGASHFRLEVKDNGIGIRAEDIKKLFSLFQQLDAGVTKKYPGTGLGLALVRGIVRSQGGKEGVNSEFGKGSTFYVVLPYHRE